jgi:hypothetical protein
MPAPRLIIEVRRPARGLHLRGADSMLFSKKNVKKFDGNFPLERNEHSERGKRVVGAMVFGVI